MRLTVAAVGRARAAPEQMLCNIYAERAAVLGPKLGFGTLATVIVDASRAGSATERMRDEASRLAGRMPKSAHRIALDEAGHSFSSEHFAKHLRQLRDRTDRDLVFLIGGPDGLATDLRESAAERLAFGAQTWPHLLVRAMLMEQIYRAFAILSGLPYHRPRTRA